MSRKRSLILAICIACGLAFAIGTIAFGLCFAPTIVDCCDIQPNMDDDTFWISFGSPACQPENPVLIYFEWKIYDACDTSGTVRCEGYDCITYVSGPYWYPVDCDIDDDTTYMEVDAWYGNSPCSKSAGNYIGGDGCASTSANCDPDGDCP